MANTKFYPRIKNYLNFIISDYKNSLMELSGSVKRHPKSAAMIGSVFTLVEGLRRYCPNQLDFDDNVRKIQSDIACLSSFSRNSVISNEMKRRRFLFQKNRLQFSNILILNVATECEYGLQSFEYFDKESELKWYERYFMPFFLRNKLVDIGIANCWIFNYIYRNYIDYPYDITLDKCSIFGPSSD